jgi:hypothetical protein
LLAGSPWQVDTRLTLAAGARALATGANGKELPEVLHNSMSDGFYDVKNRKVAQAEPVPQARPRNVQQAISSLSEPNYLMNSMSGALGMRL